MVATSTVLLRDVDGRRVSRMDDAGRDMVLLLSLVWWLTSSLLHTLPYSSSIKFQLRPADALITDRTTQRLTPTAN